MAIGTALATTIGAAATVGSTIVGAFGNRSGGSNTSDSSVNLGPASGLEQASGSSIADNFNQYQQYSDLGPGASDVSAGVGANRDLAALLQQYQQSGGAPSGQDIGQANQYANQLFAGQRVGAQQSALQAQQQFQAQAAIQGRGGLDPVFQNKVAQQQQQQEALINANQGAFAAQSAQQFSQNRLGYAAQRSNVLGGLASQALSNRQALVSMGSQLQSAERNFRLASANRSTTGQSTQTSGGGLGGAITGGLAGLGAGLGLMNQLTAPQPQAPQASVPQANQPSLGNYTF